jgi:hypothetical protein
LHRTHRFSSPYTGSFSTASVRCINCLERRIGGAIRPSHRISNEPTWSPPIREAPPKEVGESDLVALARPRQRLWAVRVRLTGTSAISVHVSAPLWPCTFTGDLETVATSQLPFISSTLLSWMQGETVRLHEVASRLPAFQNPAIEAVHGDLNEGNILVTAKDWFICRLG